MVETADGQRIAAFIDLARRRQPRLSIRAAADAAGISEGWWRQLVSGYQRRGDVDIPVVGSPDTYLAMAQVVGVASEVRNMLGEEAPDVDSTARLFDGDGATDTVEAIRQDPALNEVARDHLLRQYAILREWSEPADRNKDSRPETPADSQRPLRAVARKRPKRIQP